MNRRQFLTLTGAASICAATNCPLLATAADAGQIIDAGPASNYAKDGVYDAYRIAGFFIIKRGGELTAISSICTHRQTSLKAQPDSTFYCKRHGSIFDPTGHPTNGPATRNLPKYATSVSPTGHLLVHT